MASKTSTRSKKVARKTAARRVASSPAAGSPAAESRSAAAKAAKRRKPASKSPSGKVATANRHVAKPNRQVEKPKLLSGGNPQIAKAYGDAPVQAYIAAMPGWKRDVGSRLDAIITRAFPGVFKAVKWNSPLYGIEGQGWFLGIHCFAKYIKVAFFRGVLLRPVPPGESKTPSTRYLNIHEDDPLDEAQLANWVKQASKLPGERM